MPDTCSGKVANGLVHVADWHPTFAALGKDILLRQVLNFLSPAGVTINATGPRAVDGLNVWSHLQSCGSQPSPRTELLHHYDGPRAGAFRSGDLKLIVGPMSPWCWDADYPDEEGKTCTPGTGKELSSTLSSTSSLR